MGARQGNIDAISACVGYLSSESDEVREAAWEVIRHLAQEGCKVVISAWLASLNDKSDEVVRAAAELLAEVAPEGHVASVGCLAAALLLRSRGETSDEAILDSLGSVAARGNHTAVLATMQFIARSVPHEEQCGAEGRWFRTFEALREMADKDDVMVISFIASYLG